MTGHRNACKNQPNPTGWDSRGKGVGISPHEGRSRTCRKRERIRVVRTVGDRRAQEAPPKRDNLGLVFYVGRRGSLLRGLIPFPKRERILFGVLANREVPHLRHRSLGLADFAAESLDLCGRLGHRGNSNVIGDRLARMHALHQTAVGRIVAAAGVDVPIIRHVLKLLDLPTEQRAVKLPRPLDIVRRNFKPGDAGWGLRFVRFRGRLCLCTHGFPFLRYVSALRLSRQIAAAAYYISIFSLSDRQPSTMNPPESTGIRREISTDKTRCKIAARNRNRRELSIVGPQLRGKSANPQSRIDR